MLALADSRILATLVSGVLLVVKNAMIPREQVKQALLAFRVWAQLLSAWP